MEVQGHFIKLQKQPPEVILLKKVSSYRFRKIHKKTPVPVIKLKAKAFNFIKREALAQMFSCEFYEISKNTCFTKHLRTTASKTLTFSSMRVIRGVTRILANM